MTTTVLDVPERQHNSHYECHDAEHADQLGRADETAFVRGVLAQVADLKLKRDEAAGLVRMLENDAAPDRSIDPIKVDRFVEAAAGILRDDQDARRRALIQLVVRKAFLDEGGLALSGDPADLAKAVAVCKKNQGYLVPSFVREWRAREDSNS